VESESPLLLQEGTAGCGFGANAVGSTGTESRECMPTGGLAQQDRNDRYISIFDAASTLVPRVRDVFK